MQPTRWPVSAAKSGGRFFGDGQFYTRDLKARMLVVTHRAPVAQTTPTYLFRLNTGRILDQWQTMTRTAPKGSM